jgi:putative ABC transport system ATP-binding protein
MSAAFTKKTFLDEIVSLSNVTKSYGPEKKKILALDSVSLTVKSGELSVVSGPSGSGKSTLLHIMGLLDKPTDGKAVFAGGDVSSMSDKKMAATRNKKTGIVFQSFHLLPRMSSVENVSLPLLYSGMKKKRASEFARDALSRVGLSDRETHRPGEMSGGECQRVAIARAIVNNPLIIFADEPTGNLDQKTGRDILGLFEKIHADKETTVVMITHDESAVSHWGRKIRMRDGKIVCDE